MANPKIMIKDDFGKFVGGRYNTIGDYSGEKFREEILIPKLKALKENEKLTIDMNGVLGYGSSFLDEAFGGLVREGLYTLEQLKQKMELLYKNTSYIDETWQYIEEEEERRAKKT